MIFLKKAYDFLIKKLYGKFNGKLFTYASVPGSYVALAYLLLKKKKNQIIVLPANAIGDCIYVFSFLENLSLYAEKTNSQLIVCASDRYKGMLETYDFPQGLSFFDYLKQHTIRWLSGGYLIYDRYQSLDLAFQYSTRSLRKSPPLRRYSLNESAANNNSCPCKN